MVEGARLESAYTREGIGGSNPSLSAMGFFDRKIGHDDTGDRFFCNFAPAHNTISHP